MSLMVVLSYNVCHGHEEQHSMDYVSYIQTMLPRTIHIQLLSLTDMKLVRAQKIIRTSEDLEEK